MNTEPCTDCADPGTTGLITTKGNGKCSECGGVGKTPMDAASDLLLGVGEDCPKCDGSGRCPTCDGTGWLD